MTDVFSFRAQMLLQGGSSADVDRKATELEHATMAAAAAAAAAASDEANGGISSGAEDANGAPVFAAAGDGCVLSPGF